MGWFTSKEPKDHYAANESGPAPKKNGSLGKKVGGGARSAADERRRRQAEALKKY